MSLFSYSQRPNNEQLLGGTNPPYPTPTAVLYPSNFSLVYIQKQIKIPPSYHQAEKTQQRSHLFISPNFSTTNSNTKRALSSSHSTLKRLKTTLKSATKPRKIVPKSHWKLPPNSSKLKNLQNKTKTHKSSTLSIIKPKNSTNASPFSTTTATTATTSGQQDMEAKMWIQSRADKRRRSRMEQKRPSNIFSLSLVSSLCSFWPEI